jgi:hypothetical protein
MKKGPNMHSIDRTVRLIIGLICSYVGFIDTSLISNRSVAILVGIFGIANIWAFLTSRCPVYSAVGFSTANKTDSNTETTAEQ